MLSVIVKSANMYLEKILLCALLCFFSVFGKAQLYSNEEVSFYKQFERTEDGRKILSEIFVKNEWKGKGEYVVKVVVDSVFTIKEVAVEMVNGNNHDLDVIQKMFEGIRGLSLKEIPELSVSQMYLVSVITDNVFRDKMNFSEEHKEYLYNMINNRDKFYVWAPIRSFIHAPFD